MQFEYFVYNIQIFLGCSICNFERCLFVFKVNSRFVHYYKSYWFCWCCFAILPTCMVNFINCVFFSVIVKFRFFFLFTDNYKVHIMQNNNLRFNWLNISIIQIMKNCNAFKLWSNFFFQTVFKFMVRFQLILVVMKPSLFWQNYFCFLQNFFPEHYKKVSSHLF